MKISFYLNDYELVFKKASALVINTYRQKALGSILLALKNGVKVYLNVKNSTLQILYSKGLLVYTVDQLFDDLENNTMCFGPDEINNNIVIMGQLGQDNTISLFQQRIHDALTDRSKRHKG